MIVDASLQMKQETSYAQFNENVHFNKAAALPIVMTVTQFVSPLQLTQHVRHKGGEIEALFLYHGRLINGECI